MKNLILLTLVAGCCAYVGAKFYLHYRVSSALDKMLLMAAPFAQIQYRGVSSSIDGRISIDGITMQMNEYRDPLTIDKLTLITPGFLFLVNMTGGGGSGADFTIPDSMGFAVDGIRASTSADFIRKIYESSQAQAAANDAETVAAVCTGKYGFAPQTLQQLGYEELEANMQMSYRQDDSNLFVDVAGGVADMYQVEMTVKLADRVTRESMLRRDYRPRLAEGRIEYLDLSLNARSAALCAEQGLPEGDILHAQVDAFAASGIENGLEFDDYVIEPYKEFLSGKSTFVLTAKPGEPVSLSQIALYKPSDVPALLNLEGESY